MTSRARGLTLHLGWGEGRERSGVRREHMNEGGGWQRSARQVCEAGPRLEGGAWGGSAGAEAPSNAIQPRDSGAEQTAAAHARNAGALTRWGS